MAVFKNMVITYAGMALFAKAQAGQEIHFTKMQIGSGQVGTRNPSALTSLVEPKLDVPIASITPNPELKNATIIGNITNKGLKEAIYICEMGIWAKDPNDGEILYGYVNCGTYGDYYAPESQGAYSWQYQINAAIGNAANVTAAISELIWDHGVMNSNTNFIYLKGSTQKEINKSMDEAIDNLKEEMKDTKLKSFETDVLMTPLTGCSGGFVNIDEIEGRTLVNLSSFVKADYHDNLWEATNAIKYTTTGKNISVINNTGRLVRCDTTSVGNGAVRRIECQVGVTKIALSANESLHNTFGMPIDGWSDANKNDLLKVMILEGDWTNKPIPQYFEGIKSVGEPVLTDNIYNPRNPIIDGYRINETNGGLFKDSNGDGHTDYLVIKPNTQYQFSGISDTTIPLAVYDSNKNYIDGWATKLQFTTPSNAYYIRFTLKNSNLNNIQLNLIQYRIEILSQGENKWSIDATKEYINKYDSTARYFIDEGRNVVEFANYKFHLLPLLKGYFLKNTQYSFSCTVKSGTGGFYLSAKYTDGTESMITSSNVSNYIKLTGQSLANKTIDFIFFSYNNGAVIRMSLDDLQINEGNQLLTFQPYKEAKTEILLREPFRQFDSIDSKVVLKRSAKEILISGDLGWYMYANSDNGTSACYSYGLAIGRKASSEARYISDFKNVSDSYLPQVTEEGVWLHSDQQYASATYIRVNHSRIGANSNDSIDVKNQKFRDYLKNNNFKLIYEVLDSNIITENLNKTLALRGYDNLIVNAGAIQPTVSYSYAKNIGERITTIEGAVESIKSNENALVKVDEEVDNVQSAVLALAGEVINVKQGMQKINTDFEQKINVAIENLNKQISDMKNNIWIV